MLLILSLRGMKNRVIALNRIMNELDFLAALAALAASLMDITMKRVDVCNRACVLFE